MDNMYLPIEESYNGQRTWDVKKFKFQFTYMDIQKAAKNRNLKRKDVLIKEEIQVYPDTTTWIRDFAYSYNEPMHNDYFWHDAYSDYPVVGVTWDQAKVFCQWRTLYKNAYQKLPKEDINPQIPGLIMGKIYETLLDEIKRDKPEALSVPTSINQVWSMDFSPNSC